MHTLFTGRDHATCTAVIARVVLSGVGSESGAVFYECRLQAIGRPATWRQEISR